MFPTEPIRNYINLSFARKTDEIAQKYAADVVAARLKFPNPSGMRLEAIMQPAVESTSARINSWIQIVRDACKEANRPVDNEVRGYMLAEVRSMCASARQHTAHALAMTLQRESAENLPGVRESLSAQLNQRISQIETDIGRELKIEELKENVQKSAERVDPKPAIPDRSPAPPIQYIDKGVETLTPAAGKVNREWTGAEKWGTGIAAVTLLVTGIGLLSSHDFRVWVGIEHPTPAPQVETPKPRLDPPVTPPQAAPAPMPERGRIGQHNEAGEHGNGRGVAVNIPSGGNAAGNDAATRSPKVNNAPNGIINDGGTMTNPTVNNYGPRSRRITQQQHDEIVPMLASDRARVIVWAYSTDTDT
jgi:hypothetical protein